MRERSVNGQTHTVRVFDHMAGEYDVVSAYNNRNGSGNHTYRVYLDHTNMTGSCSCGIFQHSKISCSHAYAVCNVVNLNPYHFVHPMFKLSTIAKIYAVSFRPIDGPEDWAQHGGPEIIPNRNLLGFQGRPRHTRIHNEMDWTEDIEPHCTACNQDGHRRGQCPTVPTSQMVCPVCHTLGHNRRTCPTTQRTTRRPTTQSGNHRQNV